MSATGLGSETEVAVKTHIEVGVTVCAALVSRDTKIMGFFVVVGYSIAGWLAACVQVEEKELPV